MKKWYIKTGNEIFKDSHFQETSKADEDTKDKKNNSTQESTHTQVGWSMHQDTMIIMSDDDTDKTVSGDK